MKAYTDIEQSKKLAEILPLESVDMYYHNRVDIPDNFPLPIELKHGNPLLSQEIPCWSLAALFDVLPNENIIDKTSYGKYYCLARNIITENYDNPVDACVAMIEHLHELNLL